MKRALQNEFTLLIGLFFLGLLTRSLHYSEYLNFSTDQALFATKSLELWRSKAITLIGPSISFKFIGRELFQGSL
ncbi:hypothetical protein KC726_04745, partial [Candidatus Woesebacteria bacterium]|nr:hypothetical protein [Candidatus Woesebacteria bacterium]